MGEAYSRVKVRAVILVPLIVFVVVVVFLVLGHLATIFLGMPFSLALPLPARLLGLLLLASGFSFLGWLFRYRRPIDILVSTYVTFLKAGRGIRLEERSGRIEPLVISGPYRYVRHPLYSGVVVLVVGWWLLLDYSFLLLSAMFLLLWFNFVVARFEEEELRAIFGEEYEKYVGDVPKLIPFTKRRKK